MTSQSIVIVCLITKLIDIIGAVLISSTVGIRAFFEIAMLMLRLFAATTLLGVVLIQTAAGATLKWNISASDPSNPAETVTGYFLYDTDTSEILNWNVIANGYFAVNSDFLPPASYTLRPCESGCSAAIYGSSNPALSGGELNFFDTSNPNPSFYVGLGLPLGYALNSTAAIELVGGDPYSAAVAYNSTNEALGYTEFGVSGSLTYGGSVLDLEGGTAQDPVSLGLPGLGAVETSIGGPSGLTQFYSISGASGQSALASIFGAQMADSFTFELLTTGGQPLETAVLNSADGFESTLSLPAFGSYVIGVIDDGADDPTLTIAFSSPLNATPEPSMFALMGIGIILACVIGLRKPPLNSRRSGSLVRVSKPHSVTRRG